MLNGNGDPTGRLRRPGVPSLMTYRIKSAPFERWLENALFLVGSVLMPVGLVAIVMAWYGAAHTGYVFEQLPYLISGGLLGLGLIGTGGFLFFGSWLARIAHRQQAQTEILALGLGQVAAALAELKNENGAVDGEAVTSGRRARRTRRATSDDGPRLTQEGTE
jgi:hypothetical protein